MKQFNVIVVFQWWYNTILSMVEYSDNHIAGAYIHWSTFFFFHCCFIVLWGESMLYVGLTPPTLGAP